MEMKIQHINIGEGIAKAMFRGKFVSLNARTRKEKRSQINDLKVSP